MAPAPNISSRRCRANRAVCWVCSLLAVLLIVLNLGWAASKQRSIGEIALYQGPDRQKILLEGAKQEGEFTLYTSQSWINNVVAKEFEKKYPFIKVSAWRSDSEKLLKRALEEHAAGQLKADAVETSYASFQVLRKESLLQEYYTPEAAYYLDEVKQKGESGLYYLADREIYYGIGLNTNLIPPAAAPKNRLDLLNPKWQGKMSIVGSSTGVRWIGNTVRTMALEYLEKLSGQNIRVHNLLPNALTNLIVAGEVPLALTITNTNITLAKNKGAPVEWRPFPSSVTNIGLAGMISGARHPHVAMLFLDYLFSKEGQTLVMQGELSSPRKDLGGLETGFEKDYLDMRYSFEEYERKYNEWESLLERLFMRKR